MHYLGESGQEHDNPDVTQELEPAGASHSERLSRIRREVRLSSTAGTPSLERTTLKPAESMVAVPVIVKAVRPQAYLRAEGISSSRAMTASQGDRGSLALNLRGLVLAAGREKRYAGTHQDHYSVLPAAGPATIGLYAENTVTGDELDRWEVGEFFDLDTGPGTGILSRSERHLQLAARSP